LDYLVSGFMAAEINQVSGFHRGKKIRFCTPKLIAKDASYPSALKNRINAFDRLRLMLQSQV